VSTPPDDITIRSGRAEDRAAIEAVTVAAYEQYAAVLPAPLWAGYRQNIVATLTAAQPANLIVAEAGGALVGSVLLIPAGGAMAAPGLAAAAPLAEPELRLLAVAPAGRGHREPCSRPEGERDVRWELHFSEVKVKARTM